MRTWFHKLPRRPLAEAASRGVLATPDMAKSASGAGIPGQPYALAKGRAVAGAK